MTRRRLIIAAVVLLVAIAAAGWRFGGWNRPQITVSEAVVSEGPIVREVLTSGTLEPAEAVDVGSQVSGTVQSLHADFNSQVKAGDLLAQLDPSIFDSRLAQARAAQIAAEGDVQRAQVMARDAAVKAQRARELAARDLITAAELETAALLAKQTDAELVAARAAAAAAAASVAEAKVNRERTTIRSPIDGLVISRTVEVGQTLAASVSAPTLFRIAAIGRMRLLADVSEAEVGGVRPGSAVTFRVESLGDRARRGVVSEVRLQPMFTVATGGSRGTTSAPQPVGTAGPSSTSAPSSGSSSRTSPASGSAAGASTPGSATASTDAAPPAGSVISYTAVIDVANDDHAIAPGSTAVVFLPTGQRGDAVRIPNEAVTFRPDAGVLAAAGQKDLQAPQPEPVSPAGGRTAVVWKFVEGKFIPIEVRIGLSDEEWTELLEGPIRPGDSLVTSAAAG
jgi:HlyD family secretion protein